MNVQLTHQYQPYDEIEPTRTREFERNLSSILYRILYRAEAVPRADGSLGPALVLLFLIKWPVSVFHLISPPLSDSHFVFLCWYQTVDPSNMLQVFFFSLSKPERQEIDSSSSAGLKAFFCVCVFVKEKKKCAVTLRTSRQKYKKHLLKL